MTETPSREELEAAHCWEEGDRVPGRPELTDFRRRLRYHQAQWREANGHPVGSQPIVPREGAPSRPAGSRVPLEYAHESGATFLTAAAHEAAKARTSVIEPHQSFDHQPLWAELLWSPALAFNLFGDLAADLGLADRAVHTWWPDVSGTVSDVRFAHSPGRLDPAWLGNLVVLDAAFVLPARWPRARVSGMERPVTDTRSLPSSGARATSAGWPRLERSPCTLSVRWSAPGRRTGKAGTRSGPGIRGPRSTWPTASTARVGCRSRRPGEL